MLQVGNLPTVEQNRAHFGAWCVISAPLYLGFDLRNRSLVDAMMPIIGNAEAIAVNQQYAVCALPARSRESLLVPVESLYWYRCSVLIIARDLLVISSMPVAGPPGHAGRVLDAPHACDRALLHHHSLARTRGRPGPVRDGVGARRGNRPHQHVSTTCSSQTLTQRFSQLVRCVAAHVGLYPIVTLENSY